MFTRKGNAVGPFLRGVYERLIGGKLLLRNLMISARKNLRICWDFCLTPYNFCMLALKMHIYSSRDDTYACILALVNKKLCFFAQLCVRELSCLKTRKCACSHTYKKPVPNDQKTSFWRFLTLLHKVQKHWHAFWNSSEVKTPATLFSAKGQLCTWSPVFQCKTGSTSAGV